MSVVKKLSKGLRSSGGRNSKGRIASFHRGGGHKRRYRFVDMKRDLVDVGGIVVGIEKDPNRTSLIALVCYSNGLVSYIVAPDGLKQGDRIVTSGSGDLSGYSRVGSRIPLKYGRVGEPLSSVELVPGKGAQLARAAGSFVQFVKSYDDGNKVLVKTRSGVLKVLDGMCYGMIGVTSNLEHGDRVLGKAGRSRWLGKRPVVRGVAMNPVDHPHGGGEGKKSGQAKTPWGWNTKGKKTRSKLKTKGHIR